MLASFFQSCYFFSCKKSTIGNKSTQIEKACSLGIGSPGFCSQDISDAFTLVQLPNGMIATQEMMKRWALPENKIDFVHGGENEETNKFTDYITEQKRSRMPDKQEKKRSKLKVKTGGIASGNSPCLMIEIE